jgi:hypothetical protein
LGNKITAEAKKPSARIRNFVSRAKTERAAGAAKEKFRNRTKFHSTEFQKFKPRTTRMKASSFSNTISPNHALQTTTYAVTECAPSRTFRASAGRV